MFNVPELRVRIAVAMAVDRKDSPIERVNEIEHDVEVVMEVVEKWLLEKGTHEA